MAATRTSATQRWLERFWYDSTRTPPLWLRFLALIYAALGALRRGLYRARWFKTHALPVPVIVVGNISVGGTGKTPLTIALVEALRVRGWHPGVISRGYGAINEGPMLVDDDSSPALVGDEPCLIRRRTHIPVAIGRDRVTAARLLLAASKPNVLIADDGLQHYALRRDVEICVVDGVRRFGNGRLLPAGPLRETPVRLRDVEFIVCNGGSAEQDEIGMRLLGNVAHALADSKIQFPLGHWAGQRVHAVAAIGNPSGFFSALRGAGIDIIEHVFPDHHAYVPQDLAFDDALPVIMTEKDAVKCAAFARADQWFVPITADLPQSFFDAVAAKLVQA